jgi:adenine specific DNA methylase Mod
MERKKLESLIREELENVLETGQVLFSLQKPVIGKYSGEITIGIFDSLEKAKLARKQLIKKYRENVEYSADLLKIKKVKVNKLKEEGI